MVKIKDQFIKSIGILVSGSLLAQLITLISAPLMTRLFSVNDIGIYTYIITIAYLFLPVINARYELLIVTEKDENTLNAGIKLCGIICLVFSLFLSLGYGIYFFINPKYHQFVNVFFGIPILLVIAGFIEILVEYNNRYKQYHLLTKANLVKSCIQGIFIVIFGVLNFGSIGLILSHFISQIFCLYVQSKKILGNIKNILSVKNVDVFRFGIKNYRLPLYSIPAAIANNLSYLCLNFFIEILFGMVALGYYSLSFRILGMPLSLISHNVGMVFLKEASQQYNNNGEFRGTLLKMTRFLIMLSIPIAILIYYFAPIACGIYFGTEWTIAGEYAKSLTIMFACRFIVSPLTASMVIIKKNNIEFLMQFAFLITAGVVYVYAKNIGLDVLSFLQFINGAYSALYLIYWVVLYNLSGKHGG